MVPDSDGPMPGISRTVGSTAVVNGDPLRASALPGIVRAIADLANEIGGQSTATPKTFLTWSARLREIADRLSWEVGTARSLPSPPIEHLDLWEALAPLADPSVYPTTRTYGTRRRVYQALQAAGFRTASAVRQADLTLLRQTRHVGTRTITLLRGIGLISQNAEDEPTDPAGAGLDEPTNSLMDELTDPAVGGMEGEKSLMDEPTDPVASALEDEPTDPVASALEDEPTDPVASALCSGG